MYNANGLHLFCKNKVAGSIPDIHSITRCRPIGRSPVLDTGHYWRFESSHLDMSKIVKEATKEYMDGDNDFEKELNAYLTKQFIYSKDIPSDECLPEVKDIIEIIKKYFIMINK